MLKLNQRDIYIIFSFLLQYKKFKKRETMKIEQTGLSELQEVYDLVEDTIRNVYPKYYPQDVVTFFCDLHSRDNIKKDILEGKVFHLISQDKLVGTITIEGDHIKRLFIDISEQGKGYGHILMEFAEEKISQEFQHSIIDSSLPAIFFYLDLNYNTVRHEKIKTPGEGILVYEVMVKNLKA